MKDVATAALKHKHNILYQYQLQVLFWIDCSDIMCEAAEYVTSEMMDCFA